MRRTALTALAALLALTSCGPARGEPASGSGLDPRLGWRSLAILRDGLAAGRELHEFEIVLLHDLGVALARVDDPVGPADLEALVAFALAGGDPARVAEVLARRAVPVDAGLATALTRYARGERDGVDAALRRFGETAPTDLRALIDLATAGPDPAVARGRLRAAELGAPGTLVEEAALRRRIGLGPAPSPAGEAPEAASLGRYVHAVEAYLRRFAASPFAAPAIREATVRLVALLPDPAGAADDHAIDRLALALDQPQRGRFVLEFAREALLANRQALARRALRHAPQGKRRERYAALLSGATPPGRPDDGGVRDRALVGAARLVRAGILASPRDPRAKATASGPGDVPDAAAADWRMAAPDLERAGALLERSR